MKGGMPPALKKRVTMPQPFFLDTTAPPSVHHGAIMLFVVLGLIAVYLLLPRPRPYRIWWGAIIAALALAVAGFLLIRISGTGAETVLFYIFSAIAVVAGGLLITQRNPVKAALSFALVVLSTCGLFLLQAAPFLMAATIIIYAGAILVTFLFVIMLAQQVGLSDADARSREPLLSCIAGFVLLGAILYVLHASYATQEMDDLLGRTEQAMQQSSAEAIDHALSDRITFIQRFLRAADREASPSETSGQIHAALNDLEALWKDRNGDTEKMKQALAKLHEAGVQVRINQGSVQPPPQVLLSPYSRPVTRGPNRAGSLPQENVAYLGLSLFTDYLLAVELGGTLLLVATIGAIAITARRAEGLR
jgi:NADH:ubiquinone oxidoreductase subunit 6 (subunit J)